MLFKGCPELVGVTIHHIDSGIDSGDIVLSGRPDFELSDNFEMIEAKVFRLGIDLMILAVRQLMQGTAVRVKQWEKGSLLLRKTGYVYHPYLRVEVNNLIQKGLIRDYFSNRTLRDAQIKLIGFDIARRIYPGMEHLQKAHRLGQEIGSHGHNHYKRENIDRNTFEDELQLSTKALKGILGEPPRIFSYFFSSYVNGDDQIYAKYFLQVVTVEKNFITKNSNPLRLPRYSWPGSSPYTFRRRRWLLTGTV